MNKGKTVFSQLMSFLPLSEFRKCVKRYNGNYKVQSFSCLDQFLCMAFAQLTYRESLRDITACLRAMQSKLYHIGIRGKVSKSTLADANEKRDWRIYADFAQKLISHARKLYAQDPLSVDLDNTVYALDSTMINLCLSVFPWARYTKYSGAVKLHTLLDLRGNIPSFVHITDGKASDISILDQLIPESGAFYVLDRGYYKFATLYSLSQEAAYFVIRATKQLRVRRVYSNSIEKSSGLICDQIVAFVDKDSMRNYPEKIRRIKFRDIETNKSFVFLTNNMALDALTICQLYKCRWQIELFFKWIKQHLRIKAFYGTSFNAVKTQIWIAVSMYVLVAIIKKRLRIGLELYTILQILSVAIFEKTELFQLLTDCDYINTIEDNHNQLKLFN